MLLNSNSHHVKPNHTHTTSSSSSSPSSSKQHSSQRSMASRGLIIFFCCVTLYDAFMSYQYGKSMRQLLSSYPENQRNIQVGQEFVPYRNRVGSVINRYYYDPVHEDDTANEEGNNIDNMSNTFIDVVPTDVNDDQPEEKERDDESAYDVPTDADTTTEGSVADYHEISTVLTTDTNNDTISKNILVQQEKSSKEDSNNEKVIIVPTEDEQANDDDTKSDDNSTKEDDHEQDDEPWVLISDKNKKTTTKTEQETSNQQNEEGSLDDGSTNDMDQEEILFQEAIQNDAHVSLYRNYQEFISRPQRFPSVEERVKLYMSTWYNPPILPCSNSDNDHVDLHTDPRLHYNYVTKYDEATKEHSTIIIIRQSQSISVNNHNNHKRERLFTLDNIPRHSRLTFVYNYTVLSKDPYRTDAFIDDALHYYAPSLERLKYHDTAGTVPSDGPLPIPILLQVGDSEQYRMYAPDVDSEVIRPIFPVIKKFRYSMEPKELKNILKSQNDKKCNVDGVQTQPRRVTRTVRLADNESLETKPYRTQPIVSIMSHTKRHYGPLTEIVAADRPWNMKLNMAVYRGALTGMNKATVRHDAEKSSEEEEVRWCKDVPRCNLVLQHGTSDFVDAKLTKVPFVTGVTEGARVQPVLNGVTMEGDSMTYSDMLQYKAIIMLEGNDVASGLKWALYSNSIVMMSKPTCTSWAMEELLIPYVQYIPLNDDLSNVEEQVRWMIEHDTEAEQIANNGRLWMTDLIFHPDVNKDTDAIIDETFRRYMQHFYYNPTLQISESSMSNQEKSSALLDTKE